MDLSPESWADLPKKSQSEVGAALWAWISNAARWAAAFASELIQYATPWIITGLHFPLLLRFPLQNVEEPTNL